MQLRDIIIQILRSSERPLGAYDIATQIARVKGGKYHANSVYRILTPMIQCGDVQSIAITHSFALVETGPRALIWCVCKICRSFHPLDAEAVHRSLDTAARAEGFRPSLRHVELIGQCSNCS
jgi:Fe2+ or Zn2+ uptake regulation protein